MLYSGNEHFIANGEEIGITMTDFWRWSHPDFLDSSRRTVLAKFIVASSIGLSDFRPQDKGGLWKPYDLLTGDGYRVQIESASYLQSEDGEHPSHVSFPIPSWDADVYIFSLFKATAASQNPLDLDIWEFFALSAAELPEKKPSSITLPRLMDLGVWQSDYYGIADAIRKAADA